MSTAINTKLREAAARQQQGSADLPAETNEAINKVMTFYIEDQLYAIEVPDVIEIIGLQPFTFVPGIPDYINGIINVRSKVVPVVEVRKRFGKPVKSYDERTCIIIVSNDGDSVGLVVDRVSGVLDVKESNISDTPDHSEVNATRFISYIIRSHPANVLVLDINKLLNEES